MTQKSIRSQGPFRLALVTGASSGIGKAVCRLLARKGIHLIITGRNKMNLSHLADELRQHVNVVVYPADLTNREERKKIVQKIRELTPDLVVNNAGSGLYGLATKIGVDPQLDMIELDVNAVVELTVEAAKSMLETGQKGVIMNVSSVAGFVPFPGFAAYAASKSFVNAYSVALDAELKEKGIHVLASCPGMVETNFSSRASGGRSQSSGEKKMTPEFAAGEIWRQILSKKPVHAFSWKYRLSKFLLQYVIPSSLAAKYLKNRMLKRVK